MNSKTEQKNEQMSSSLASLIAIMAIHISSALVDTYSRILKEKKDTKTQGGEKYGNENRD